METILNRLNQNLAINYESWYLDIQSWRSPPLTSHTWERSRTELRRRTHGHRWGSERCGLLLLLPRQVIVQRPSVWLGPFALCRTEESRWQMQTLPGNTGVSRKWNIMRCENIVMVPDAAVLGAKRTEKSESKSQSYTDSLLFNQKETLRLSVGQ